jgi:uncharacterized linocin/CFP29 family protein
MVGPLGWGVEQAPVFGFTQQNGAAVIEEAGRYLALEDASAEFVLRARQMAMAVATPFGLDLGAVAMAAADVARQEDACVLGGLLAAAGASGALGDWDALGSPFRAVAEAEAQMLGAGYDGPYALVMAPAMYARLASNINCGRREIEVVEKLVRAGIHQSPVVPADRVLLLSPQPWNMDMVVGQDVITAYLGNEGLDHRFRVFETLVLRVKRSGGVCVLG